jgi:hypothetical protein
MAESLRLMSFKISQTPGGRFSPVLFSPAKSKHKLGKHAEFFHVHVTVGAADGIEFSAASRCATVANGVGGGACGKGFREKNTTLMEEEMLVGDVVSQIADDPGVDGMGCCTPFVGGGGKNVKAARMRKAEFLFLSFSNSLSSGRSDICVEQEEGVTRWKCNRWRERNVTGGFVSHGVVC